MTSMLLLQYLTKVVNESSGSIRWCGWSPHGYGECRVRDRLQGNDLNKWCKFTYDLNHGDPPLTVANINDVDPESLPDHDILTGGFPCQPFSAAGLRKGFKDDRGTLFFSIANILDVKKPRSFLLENVKGLVGHDKGKTLRVILKICDDLGYHVRFQVLNSKIHANVPQNRERIFLVGFKSEEVFRQFRFPDPIPLTTMYWDLLEKDVKMISITSRPNPSMRRSNHI